MYNEVVQEELREQQVVAELLHELRFVLCSALSTRRQSSVKLPENFLVVERKTRWVEADFAQPRKLEHDEQEVWEIDDGLEPRTSEAPNVQSTILLHGVLQIGYRPHPRTVAPDVRNLVERPSPELVPARPKDGAGNITRKPLLDEPVHLGTAPPDLIELGTVVSVVELAEQHGLHDLVLLELLAARVHDLEVVVQVNVLGHLVKDDVNPLLEVLAITHTLGLRNDVANRLERRCVPPRDALVDVHGAIEPRPAETADGVGRLLA